MEKGAERSAEALAAEALAEHDGVALLSSATFQEGRDSSVRIRGVPTKSPTKSFYRQAGSVKRGVASTALFHALAVLSILIIFAACLLSASFHSISVTSCSHPNAALRHRAAPHMLQKALVARRLFGRVAQVFTSL